MKTAHDLVAAAKTHVREVSIAEADQASALQEMGYLNVQSIAGGYDAWVGAGKPIVTPDTPSFD